MAKVFIDEILLKIKLAYNLAGLRLNNNDKISYISIKYIYIANAICLNSNILAVTAYFVVSIKNGENLTELAFIAPCVTLSVLGSIKSVFHWTNEDLVDQLIVDIRKLESISKKYIVSDDQKDLINCETKFLNMVIKTLNIFNIAMVVVFSGSPLVLITIKYFTRGKLELMLPFNDVYPFDAFDLRCWPFVYVYQFWSECVVLLDICCADYFFYICCTYIRIQFRLIQHEFENLISCKSAGRVRYSDQEFRDKFVNLIKWHQEVISSVDMLEIIYAKSTLFNFLASSIVICFTGFNVTTIDDLTFVVVFMTFLFMSLFQIYFLCFFGDLLMRSSMDVCDAVYKCSWYLADAGIRKDIVVIQIRAQKPCKLTAFGFSDVNLNAFMRVLSTSWSYFALLQTVYG